MIASKRRLPVTVRGELCAALVATIPARLRTLNVELLAESFVDAFDDPRNARRPLALVEWVDRMCDVHAEDPGVTKMFSKALTTIERYAGSRYTPFDSSVPLRTLDDAIGAIVAKHRAKVLPPVTRVDEIDAAINVLIQRLERSDPFSADHCRAVGAWCTRLARRLSLSESVTTYVGRGGLIHDVGKITTPYEILHAPRKLTDDEFDVMRSHTTAGERMILEYPSLRGLAVMARSHHERLDGRGYPDRLPADDISIEIRIATVADSFNAMIGRRPYRPPMPPAAALAELERCAGTQFDPDVVAAMREVLLGLQHDTEAIVDG